MNEAYVFRIGPLVFILNVQQSNIGYLYPRIFVRFPDDSYLNCDIMLGAMFEMTEKDWLSWLDGSEKYLNTIDEVQDKCAEAGINWKEFEKIIFKLYDENKEEQKMKKYFKFITCHFEWNDWVALANILILFLTIKFGLAVSWVGLIVNFAYTAYGIVSGKHFMLILLPFFMFFVNAYLLGMFYNIL